MATINYTQIVRLLALRMEFHGSHKAQRAAVHRQQRINTRGPIYKIYYDLSYDYL